MYGLVIKILSCILKIAIPKFTSSKTNQPLPLPPQLQFMWKYG